MTAPSKSSEGPEPTAAAQEKFSAEERAAMKERAGELKAAGRRGTGSKKAQADEQDLLTKIADMPQPDRGLAEQVHAIVTAAAPDLSPKTWYGMPAWAREGKVVCFFQAAEKFKTRYSTLGFSDEAALEDGTMWPTAYALTGIDKAEEEAIQKLVLRAES